jgi:hypothetical protein
MTHMIREIGETLIASNANGIILAVFIVLVIVAIAWDIKTTKKGK